MDIAREFENYMMVERGMSSRTLKEYRWVIAKYVYLVLQDVAYGGSFVALER
jgi:site-specific recombinase XerC